MTSTTKRSRRHLRVRAAVLATAVLCAAALAASAGASENGPSATGSGHFWVNDELRTFTFSALTHEDGTVTGEAQLDAHATDFSEHVSVNCLEVDGNQAFISGTITDSSRPDFVGGTALFSVQDNGEGSDAAPDRISLLASRGPGSPLPPLDCNDHLPPNEPVEAGNVQVHQ
jgi:hypothetical protein